MRSLKKNFWPFFRRAPWSFWVTILVLVGGFIVRLVSTSDHNLMFGYDEIQDLILARRIALDLDLIVIGKAIYGNPDIRHGVMSYYLMAPGLVLSRDPSFIAMWDGLFNLAAAVVVYFTAKSIFKDMRIAVTATALFTFSYLVVAYSNWVAHPTFALLFVSLFYLGLWKMFEGKNWGFILGAVSLGLSIQSDLIFIYLIPILFIFMVIYKPKYPGLTTLVISISSFLVVMSSFIYAELKFNFASLRTVLNFSKSLDANKVAVGERVISFLGGLFEVFSYNVVSRKITFGVLVGVLIISAIFYFFFKSKKQDKYGILFLIFYIFSPAIMLIIGYHDKPWGLMGVFPAVSIAIAFVISKIKFKPLFIALLGLILVLNIKGTLTAKAESRFFVDIPRSSILSSQLNVVDYTYTASNGSPFAIDAVNYPLYVNSYWSYHYAWYGLDRYDYKPGWAGSDQLYPYNTLLKSSGEEEYLYLIIDETPDIPMWAKVESKRVWDIKTLVLEEREMGGFIVQKRKARR